MTVAVAHQGTNDSDHVLLEAVREAHARGESLAVIHVRAAVDDDLEAAVAGGVADAVGRRDRQGEGYLPCPTSCASPPAPLRTSPGRCWMRRMP